MCEEGEEFDKTYLDQVIQKIREENGLDEIEIDSIEKIIKIYESKIRELENRISRLEEGDVEDINEVLEDIRIDRTEPLTTGGFAPCRDFGSRGGITECGYGRDRNPINWPKIYDIMEKKKRR